MKKATVKRNPSSVSDYDYSIKCVILGDSGVGKTCLMQRLQGAKHPMKSTPSVDGIFHRRSQLVHDRTLQLSIWDTAGTEAFKSVTRIFYRGASCAFLVYDITNKITFNNISEWMEDLKQYSTNTKPIIILVANKSDKEAERQVSKEKGEQFAKEHNMSYIETSALNGENIERAFEMVSQQVYDSIKIGSVVPNAEVNGIKVGSKSINSASSEENSKDKQKKGGCC